MARFVFDRRAIFSRAVEIGRGPLNEPLTAPQEIARGWASAGAGSVDEVRGLGLASGAEVLAITLRGTTALAAVRIDDQVGMQGADYRVKGRAAPALAARGGLMRFLLVREGG
ncbi:MAG: hypothetical protein PHX82_16805 [Paracoccaceae bacterium]|nr:hypothetical protein [Paracoccaceae bacterium]